MLLTVALLILVGPVAVITAMFALELLFGLPRMASRAGEQGGSASAVIIVPAHNEAAGIRANLKSLKASGNEFRIVVIADNCVDDTAGEARLAGVEVLERFDPKQKGKGFALEAAASALEKNPPDVVVIIDADCSIDKPSLGALVATAAATGRPAQAINLLRAAKGGAPMVQLSTFAFVVKNLIRQRGLQRLIGEAHLTGTGMALPFRIFRSARLGTADIVEDLVLGLELSKRGYPAQLVPQAFVWSPSSGVAGTLIQRRRWEGGFLKAAFRWGPRTILEAARRGDSRGLLKGLDLLIPPFALLIVVNAAALVVGSALLWFGAPAWPLIVLICLLGLSLLLVLMVWFREGRRFVSLRVLALMPMYVLWKLPLYLGLWRHGAPRDWLRSGR